MGQQHSLAGKGVAIPSLVTSAADNADSNHLFSPNQNAGQDHATLSNPPPSGNSANSVGGGVEQAQSVRAAIESFIETCLADSDDGPPSPKPVQGRQTPSSVEVITVPDEDESDGDSGDKGDGGGEGGGEKDKTSAKVCEGQQTKDGSASDSSRTNNTPERKTDSGSGNDAGPSLGEKPDKDLPPQSLSVSVPTKEDQTSNGSETGPVPSSKPSQTASGSSEKASTGGSSSSSSRDRDSNPSSRPSESSHGALEGIESMRLKTIIDRMLDNSLGGGSELSPVSVEQRILPQIVVEERSESSSSAPQQGDKSKSSETSGNASASGSDRRGDPMAICFMEHIEKAVERSFSSITEEEERKEKEKTLVAPSSGKGSENKNSAWSGRAPKPSDTAAVPVSAGDGTISVQDIVDRVISQTEVMAKHPLPAQQMDVKPTVSASGTFYPDKAPPVDSANHTSQPQRREIHKEETPRETTGRRGRPRMRSPCPERREPVPAPEYLHGPREAARRGPGVIPGEDYLQSMQAALAKYGTVHPAHRMAPFLPGAMPASAALAKGAVPVSATQNSFMMSGLHAPPASLQPPRLHGPQHASLSSHPPPHHGPQHSSLASQPPPLLRVDGMERGEHSHHGQPPKAPPSHPPSRSCMCSTCLMYWARDAERARMVQHHQQQQQQQQQQPSPVERGLSRMPSHPAHHPHPAYSKPVPAPSHSHKWAVDGHHLDAAKQEKPHPHYPYPRGQEAYPASHPAYGIQTGVPVPHVAYAEKQALETRHTDTHYPKPYEMGDYAHRQTKADVREMGPGRHPYPTSISASKPPSVPSHPQPHPHPHPHAHAHAHAHSHPSVHPVAGGKPDVPLLDLTYKKDSTPSGPAISEEDKPLDLSSKKPVSPMYYERQDLRHRRENEHHRYEGGEVGVDHAVHPGMMAERGREGEKYMSASQHLHNLETSVETHFQKLQHTGHHRGGIPMHNMPVSAAHHGFSAGMPPHRSSPVVPPPHSTGRPQANAGHGSAVPLPPHHPTLPPSHAGSSVGGGGGGHPGYGPGIQPVPGYSADPVLSPGGRRPQLHPIPPPNPSTTLGSAPPRSAPSFQSRTGASSVPGSCALPLAPVGSSVPMAAGLSAVMCTVPGSSTSPMVSLPSTLPRATPPNVPVAVSSPQRSGSGGIPQFPSDYPRHSGSRSVSPPPGSESRGEDGQRGSGVSRHEPIHSLLGNNNPQDILYLRCRLCRQTYGSPYGFRKHFRNQHGFEPKAEHAQVQTISATKNARQMFGGNTPTFDPESPSQDSLGRPSRTSSLEGVTYPSHSPSPRPDMHRSAVSASPGNTSNESMGDAHSLEGIGAGEHRHRNSFSRSSTDSKGRSPSGGSVGEEREDTKCLECPECGQTFQLNDFGSYKRHCRQHSQMKGAGREGSATQGVYSCAECQCSYSEPQMLQEHVQRHHANITPLTCPLCRASLPTSAEYQDHMRTVHNSSSYEATSSSPVTVSDRVKVSSASSNCDISSSSTSVKRETPTTSLTNTASSFNLTVTTPSDLEICRLPADPIVTSASPDSSSDNKKAQDADSKKNQDSSPVSSSEQGKIEGVKTESSVDSPKSGTSEGIESARPTTDNKDSTKMDTESKQFPSVDDNSKFNSASVGGSSNSSLDADDNADLFMYKHKKFSAHRKRSASNVSESSVSEAKQTCLEVNTSKAEKTQQNVVSSATEKVQSKTADSKSKAVSEETKAKATPSKTEARHPLPFVWDRVTRSQAGKHARSSDYS